MVDGGEYNKVPIPIALPQLLIYVAHVTGMGSGLRGQMRIRFRAVALLRPRSGRHDHLHRKSLSPQPVSVPRLARPILTSSLYLHRRTSIRPLADPSGSPNTPAWTLEDRPSYARSNRRWNLTARSSITCTTARSSSGTRHSGRLRAGQGESARPGDHTALPGRERERSS